MYIVDTTVVADSVFVVNADSTEVAFNLTHNLFAQRHPDPSNAFFGRPNPRGHRFNSRGVPTGSVFGLPRDEGRADRGHLSAGAAHLQA